jgi:bifunctional UDP-N-acetylglucosamine pyrophosphorylase/glucosamine-1-phosphate N-acetyltransferase
MENYAIVLAAGKGTRMKSLLENKSKVSYEILGVPLVKYVLNALDNVKICNTVVVVGFGGEITSEIVKDKADIVWQKEQKGTGHAVKQVAPILANKEGLTIILCGDTPLLTSETINELINSHVKNNNALTVLSAIVDNPHGYGRIVRDDNGNVLKIVEQADTDQKTNAIKEVNTGVCVYNNKLLFEYLNKLQPNNAQGEYYLTDLIKMFVINNLKVGVSIMSDYHEMLGINDRWQLAEAANLMKERINKRLMLSGVTIIDPNNTYIGPYVTIGQDSIIYPNTIILGKTNIGKINNIYSSYFENMSIGDGNTIIMSHLIDSEIGNNNKVGPYTRMRGHVKMLNNAKIGNFVELKNVVIHDNAKSAHLTYLGDAEIGERTNIGCGTIIANYDGINKFQSKIGNDVFVGSGTTIISPVTIEDKAFIAAGSTINRDVKENDMAIARARQENKSGYAETLRNKANSIHNKK